MRGGKALASSLCVQLLLSFALPALSQPNAYPAKFPVIGNYLPLEAAAQTTAADARNLLDYHLELDVGFPGQTQYLRLSTSEPLTKISRQFCSCAECNGPIKQTSPRVLLNNALSFSATPCTPAACNVMLNFTQDEIDTTEFFDMNPQNLGSCAVGQKTPYDATETNSSAQLVFPILNSTPYCMYESVLSNGSSSSVSSGWFIRDYAHFPPSSVPAEDGTSPFLLFAFGCVKESNISQGRNEWVSPLVSNITDFLGGVASLTRSNWSLPTQLGLRGPWAFCLSSDLGITPPTNSTVQQGGGSLWLNLSQEWLEEQGGSFVRARPNGQLGLSSVGGKTVTPGSVAVIALEMSLTSLPPSIYNPLVYELFTKKNMTAITTPPMSEKGKQGLGDLCFDASDRVKNGVFSYAGFPPLTITFFNGQNLTVEPQSYLYHASEATVNASKILPNPVPLICANFRKSKFDNRTYIGYTWLRGLFMSFDTNNITRWRKVQCSTFNPETVTQRRLEALDRYSSARAVDGSPLREEETLTSTTYTQGQFPHSALDTMHMWSHNNAGMLRRGRERVRPRRGYRRLKSGVRGGFRGAQRRHLLSLSDAEVAEWAKSEGGGSRNSMWEGEGRGGREDLGFLAPPPVDSFYTGVLGSEWRERVIMESVPMPTPAPAPGPDMGDYYGDYYGPSSNEEEYFNGFLPVVGGLSPLSVALGKADSFNGFFAQVPLGLTQETTAPMNLRIDTTAGVSWLQPKVWSTCTNNMTSKCVADIVRFGDLVQTNTYECPPDYINPYLGSFCGNSTFFDKMRQQVPGDCKVCGFNQGAVAQGYYSTMNFEYQTTSDTIGPQLAAPVYIGLASWTASSDEKGAVKGDGVLGLALAPSNVYDTFYDNFEWPSIQLTPTLVYSLCLEIGDETTLTNNVLDLQVLEGLDNPDYSAYTTWLRTTSFPELVYTEEIKGLSSFNLRSVPVILNTSSQFTLLPPDLHDALRDNLVPNKLGLTKIEQLPQISALGASAISALQSLLGPNCYGAKPVMSQSTNTPDYNKFKNITFVFLDTNDTLSISPQAYLYFAPGDLVSEFLGSLVKGNKTQNGGTNESASGFDLPLVCLTMKPHGRNLNIPGDDGNPRRNAHASVVIGFPWLRNTLIWADGRFLTWKSVNCSQFRVSSAAPPVPLAVPPPPPAPPSPPSIPSPPASLPNEPFFFSVNQTFDPRYAPGASGLFMNLQVGQPSQNFSLRLDTITAALPWLQCTSLDNSKPGPSKDPRVYNPFSSNTFNTIPCEDDFGVCSANTTNFIMGCLDPNITLLPPSNPYCAYYVNVSTPYSPSPEASISSSIGNMVADKVNVTVVNGTQELEDLLFGCGARQQGSWSSSSPGMESGILDLSFSNLSLPSQANNSWGVPHDSFSLCLPLYTPPSPLPGVGVVSRSEVQGEGVATKQAGEGTQFKGYALPPGATLAPSPEDPGVLLVGPSRISKNQSMTYPSVPLDMSSLVPILKPSAILMDGVDVLPPLVSVTLDLSSTISYFPPESRRALVDKMGAVQGMAPVTKHPTLKSLCRPPWQDNPILFEDSCFLSHPTRLKTDGSFDYSAFDSINFEFLKEGLNFSVPPQAYLYGTIIDMGIERTCNQPPPSNQLLASSRSVTNSLQYSRIEARSPPPLPPLGGNRDLLPRITAQRAQSSTAGKKRPPPPPPPAKYLVVCMLLGDSSGDQFQLGWTWLRGKTILVDYTNKTFSWTDSSNTCPWVLERSGLSSTPESSVAPPQAVVQEPPPPLPQNSQRRQSTFFSFVLQLSLLVVLSVVNTI